MSGTIQTDQYEVSEALADNNLIEVFQSSSGGVRREKKGLLSAFETFFIGNISNGIKQLNPRSFISGRFDSQELESGNLTVSGWYTIAQLAPVGNSSAAGDFIFAASNSTMTLKMKAQIGLSSSAKTHFNTDIEITGINDIFGVFLGARIAKSDVVNAAGAKLQLNLGLGSIVLLTQVYSNIGRQSGWELVTPFLDSTPTLPDGVTAGTFLEAGEEFTFGEEDTHFISGWTANRVTNNIIACELNMEQIPKQFTGITLTLPSTSLLVVDKAAPGTTFTLVSPTFSNLAIKHHRIQFRINETGIATGMLAGELGFLCTGPGGKIILT